MSSKVLIFFLTSFCIHASERYLLRVDDKVKMEVYQEDELTTLKQIEQSGVVSFPLIGAVQVAGLSLKQAEAKIEKLYRKDFLVNPKVNLGISNYAEQEIIVSGMVNTPGAIIFPKEGVLDILSAIALAGDFSENANKSKLFVTRGGKQRTINLSSSSSVDGRNFILKPKDFVLVREESLLSSTITVAGYVNSPGTVDFPKEGELDILTGIALAGDFKRIANKKEVIVRRNNQQYLVSLKNIRSGKARMFFLKPGDIVSVKESNF